MTSSVFPDINVWLALAFSAHVHHVAAGTWLESLGDERELIFCRFTQLGLLRLLTTAAVMGNRVKTQRQAWTIYDSFLSEGNARLMQEPRALDQTLRRFSDFDAASPQNWTDSYLASFAEAAEMTLVTFDKALAGRVKSAILLKC